MKMEKFLIQSIFNSKNILEQQKITWGSGGGNTNTGGDVDKSKTKTTWGTTDPVKPSETETETETKTEKQKPKKDKKEKEVTKKEEPVTKKEEPKVVSSPRFTQPVDFYGNVKVTPRPQGCNPVTTNNRFIETYKNGERDKAAHRFVKYYVRQFVNPFQYPSKHFMQCGVDEELNFIGSEQNPTKDIHKHPIVNDIADNRVGKRGYSRSEGKFTAFDAFIEQDMKKYPNTFNTMTDMNENIKKTITNKLLETKLNKSLNQKITKKLSEKKTQKLVESTKVKRSLSKLKKMYDKNKLDEFFDGLKTFVSDNKKVIKEDISDTFRNSWNMVFNDNEEDDIKKETIMKILSSLNVESGSELGIAITDNLNTMGALEMFEHPELVSSKIASTLQSKISSDLSQSTDGGLEDIVKGMVSMSVQNTENLEKLKKQIERKVEPTLLKYQSAVETLSQRMKDSFLNSLA